MKAISTIIATIILVVIAISLVGTAYLFVSGLLTGQTSKSIKLMEASGHIVIVQNMGTQNITPNDIRVLVNGEPRNIINPQTIKPGDAAALKFIPPNFGNEVVSANVIVVGPSNSLNYKIDFIPHEPRVTSGTVGLWHFDETGTTATDSSNNHNDGTSYSGTTQTDLHTSSGKLGKGLQFDGIDDYVNGSDSGILGSNEFTVEFWAKPRYMIPWMRWMGKCLYIWGPPNNFRGWVILTHSTQCCVYLAMYDATSVEKDSPSIPYTNDEWAHFAFTFNSTHIRSYKNGEVETGNSVGSWVFSPSIERFQVGEVYTNGYFNGTIDEIAIYNRALTQEEILDSIYG